MDRRRDRLKEKEAAEIKQSENKISEAANSLTKPPPVALNACFQFRDINCFQSALVISCRDAVGG